MIYIEKGELNEMLLTLTESATLTDPYFLFKFTWETDLSLDPVYWVGTNLSSYTYRYDLFEFTEGTDATLRIGQHIYEIYETNDINSADETGLTKVEEGQAVVSGVISSIYD
jgi:hypothetical protein